MVEIKPSNSGVKFLMKIVIIFARSKLISLQLPSYDFNKKKK